MMRGTVGLFLVLDLILHLPSGHSKECNINDISVVLDSTRSITSDYFYKYTEKGLLVYLEEIQNLTSKITVSGRVYHKNTDCPNTTHPLSWDEHFHPTSDRAKLGLALGMLQYYDSHDNFSLECAEDHLFSQYKDFHVDLTREPITGIIYSRYLYVYYNRVRVLTIHNHKFGIGSWEVVRAICKVIKNKKEEESKTTTATITQSKYHTTSQTTRPPQPIIISEVPLTKHTRRQPTSQSSSHEMSTSSTRRYSTKSSTSFETSTKPIVSTPVPLSTSTDTIHLTSNPPSTSAVKQKKIEKVLNKLTQIMEGNRSEIFSKRNEFVDQVEEALEIDNGVLENEPLSSGFIIQTMERFMEFLGFYLWDFGGIDINIHQMEVGIGVSRLSRDRKNMTIVADIRNASVSLVTYTNNSQIHTHNTHHFLASVFLPSSSLNESTNNTLLTAVYKEDRLFVHNLSSLVVVSAVVSIGINNHQPKNISTPVQLHFKTRDLRRKGSGTTYCAHWKFSDEKNQHSYGTWDQQGCRKVKETIDGIVHCECDHLTNFALLLDVSQQALNPLYMQIITWVGCTASLFGLFVTAALYSVVKKVKSRLPSKIAVRFCISLAFLIVVFLASGENRFSEDLQVGCDVMSAIIHYLLLLTFMWMGTSGVTMYRMLVRPMHVFDQSKFLKRVTIIDFVVPAIIVVTNAAVNPNHLSSSNFCMVHDVSFYASVLAPVATIIIFNLFVCIASLYAVFKPSIASSPMNTCEQCKMTFVMTILLGLSWCVALFGLGDAAEVVQVAVCVLSSLQGFLVFVMFVVVQKEMRLVIRGVFTKSVDTLRIQTSNRRHYQINKDELEHRGSDVTFSSHVGEGSTEDSYHCHSF